MRTRRQLFEAMIAAPLAVLMIGGSFALAAPPAGKGGGGGTTAPASVSYSITLLGTLGGDSSSARGMNGYGEIVGSSRTEEISGRQWPHAFLNVGDSGIRVMVDLHDRIEAEGLIAPFDYLNGNGWLVTQAMDINDIGQIVGTMRLVVDGAGTLAAGFRYTPAGVDENGINVPAELVELEGLFENGSFSPAAINSHGDVAGSARDADNLAHAVVWHELSGTVDLGRFDDRDTHARDINDSGQLCGLNNFSYRAWRYTTDFENLGVLSNGKHNSSTADSINNHGQVAGGSDSSKGHRAFRYTDGEGMRDLGTLGGDNSYGGSINNLGYVVGYSDTSDNEHHLFLYADELGGMADLEAGITNLPTDLYALGGNLYINDNLEVCGTAGVGTGEEPSLNGHTHEAYLLVPSP